MQLQRLLPGNRWQTVAKAQAELEVVGDLRRVEAAAREPRRSAIAMSVNQAGAGYLGAFSRTINYRRS